MLVEIQVLTYLSLLTAIIVGAQGLAIPLNFGFAWGLSNRDVPVEQTTYMRRAGRTLDNHLQAMAMGVPLLLAIMYVPQAQTELAFNGAWVFLVARAAFTLVYLVGIPYLRSALWFIGVIGLGMMATPLVTQLF